MTVREDGEAQLCRQVEADTPGLVQDHDHPSLTVFHEPAATGVLSGRRAMLVMAAGVAIALCAVVIAGIMLADAASTTNFDARNLAPALDHPFGTDWMGRDMLARTLAGLSTSVVVGLVAATVSSVIALALASAAALGGSRVDTAVSWLIDLTMGIPHMVLLILISYALGRGALALFVIIPAQETADLVGMVGGQGVVGFAAEAVSAKIFTHKEPLSKAIGSHKSRTLSRYFAAVLPHSLPHFTAFFTGCPAFGGRFAILCRPPHRHARTKSRRQALGPAAAFAFAVWFRPRRRRGRSRLWIPGRRG